MKGVVFTVESQSLSGNNGLWKIVMPHAAQIVITAKTNYLVS